MKDFSTKIYKCNIDIGGYYGYRQLSYQEEDDKVRLCVTYYTKLPKLSDSNNSLCLYFDIDDCEEMEEIGARLIAKAKKQKDEALEITLNGN